MGRVIVYPMAGPGHPIYTGELFIGARIAEHVSTIENKRTETRKKRVKVSVSTHSREGKKGK